MTKEQQCPYAVGEQVKITANTSHHKFPIGTVVTITSVDEIDDDFPDDELAFDAEGVDVNGGISTWSFMDSECEKIIDETIIENFDFERVHEIMTAINWKWIDGGVPSIDLMKDNVRKLIRTMTMNSDMVYTMAGGFTVVRLTNDKGSLKVFFGV